MILSLLQDWLIKIMGALRICCGFVSGSLSVHIHQPRFPLIPIRFLIELLKCLLKPRLAVCRLMELRASLANFYDFRVIFDAINHPASPAPTLSWQPPTTTTIVEVNVKAFVQVLTVVCILMLSGGCRYVAVCSIVRILGQSALSYSLVLVFLIPCWLAWAEIKTCCSTQNRP